jgi:hypothetical protein
MIYRHIFRGKSEFSFDFWKGSTSKECLDFKIDQPGNLEVEFGSNLGKYFGIFLGNF